MSESNSETTRFIGIGAMKTSSTWISEALRYHPEIHVSDIKELHFFSKNYELGLKWYLDRTKKDLQHKVTGEYSVSYMDDLLYLDRIFESFPEAKIIISIRNPVERFKSHLKHLIRNDNSVKQTCFNLSGLNKIIEYDSSLLSKGLYYSSIEYCLRLFGKKNVIVLKQEDILYNPLKEVAKLYKFLGVKEEFIPYNVSSRTSAGIIPKSKFIENMRVRLFRWMKNFNPKVILFIRRTGIGELYRKLNSNKPVELLDKECIKFLKNYYEKDYSMTISLIRKHKI